MLELIDSGLQLDIDVEDVGVVAKATPKTPGSIVTVNYKLRAPHLSNNVLEKGRKAWFQFDCGAVAPEMDAMVAELGLYGKATCKASILPLLLISLCESMCACLSAVTSIITHQ